MAGSRRRTVDQWRPNDVVADKAASRTKLEQQRRHSEAFLPPRSVSPDAVGAAGRKFPSRSPLREDDLSGPRHSRLESPNKRLSDRSYRNHPPRKSHKRRRSLGRDDPDARPPSSPPHPHRPDRHRSSFASRHPHPHQSRSFDPPPRDRRFSDFSRRPTSRSSNSRSPSFTPETSPRSRNYAASRSPQRREFGNNHRTSKRHEPWDSSARRGSQSPPRKRLSRKERKQRQADQRGRKFDSEPRRGRDRDMSYPYHGYSGRGGPPRGRGGMHGSYGHSPPPYPPPLAPHASPAYGTARGAWGPDPSYQHPHSPPYGYSPPHPPYRQNSYPPPPSPHGYSPPPPPPSYGGTPPYSQQPPPHAYPHYPPPPPRSASYERRGRGGHTYNQDRRHSSVSSNGSFDGPPPPRRGRGTFSNLSWTPQTGSRGGVVTHRRTREDEREPQRQDDRQPDRRHGRDFDSRPDFHSRWRDNDDDDLDDMGGDNPFRPTKEFQSEDQALKDSKNMPPPNQKSMPATESDGKISFGLNKAKQPERSPSNKSMEDLMGAHARARPRYADERRDSDREEPYKKAATPPPPPKRLIRRSMRKGKLDPDHAESESVYYRRPGNESVIGSGTYGKVFKAIHVYTHDKVALKKIRMEGERDGFPVTAIREIKLLQSLNNDNVVKLHEVMVERNDCFMVFEYLSHDLTGLLNHPTFKLSHAHKKHLAMQLFQGLDYLHQRGVIHRDIKAANILVSSSGQLKLADFGLARFYVKRRTLDYTNRVITIWYRSPELLLGETQYGPAVDIWSAACVLVEIFTKHAIFPGNGGEIDQLDKIYNVLGTPRRSEWPDIVDLSWFELLRPAERKASTFQEKYGNKMTTMAFELLSQMFAFDPKNRPTAEEVLSHSYFAAESPSPARVTELADLQGDWHEFESKALRKEKERQERQERDARKQRDAEEKRKRVESDEADKERDTKRPRLSPIEAS